MKWPKPTLALLLGLSASLGCDDLVNLTDTTDPLASVQVELSGPLPGGVRPERVRVALLWGTQYISDFFCLVPTTDAEANVVVRAGCRDPFGFVPLRVGANAALSTEGPTVLPLFDLPAADVMVGTLVARIGHGSVVVYEDRNENGTFDLACVPRRGRGSDCKADTLTDDLVLGASFVSMSQPDQRLTFREGGFEPLTAFYPRAGCPEPPVGFSVLGAGGFSTAQAFLDILQGNLPQQDPATCTQASLDAAPIAVALFRDDADLQRLQELGCGSNGVQGGFVEYEAPPADAPDEGRALACAPVADVSSLQPDQTPPDREPGEGEAAEPRAPILHAVLAGPADARCKSVTHWLLRGCEDDPRCENPEWDFTANPPEWWPCPVPDEAP
jgi:hypothetical protein